MRSIGFGEPTSEHSSNIQIEFREHKNTEPRLTPILRPLLAIRTALSLCAAFRAYFIMRTENEREKTRAKRERIHDNRLVETIGRCDIIVAEISTPPERRRRSTLSLLTLCDLLLPSLQSASFIRRVMQNNSDFVMRPLPSCISRE